MSSSCQTWRIATHSQSLHTGDFRGSLLRPVQMAPQPKTLDQASLALPGGVYSTFRTFQRTCALYFNDHLNRLEESARLAGFELSLDRGLIRSAVREAILHYPEPETRIRMTIDLQVEPGRLFISLEPLILLSPESYRLGVGVTTRCMQRENPKAKLTSFISTAITLRTELPPGINEILMVNESGQVLEGLSSNFFVVQVKQILTAGSGVLNGITRKIVLEEAQKANIPVLNSPPSVENFQDYQEAFITSASRSVLPVVQIDGHPIGPGKPGPITQLLYQRYQDRIFLEIEEI